MRTVRLRFEGGDGFRPSEIVADLRTVAETLYFPMRMCGFWDRTNDLHLCPQSERRLDCPHLPTGNDPAGEPYARTLERERQAVLEIDFPHAGISIFLG